MIEFKTVFFLLNLLNIRSTNIISKLYTKVKKHWIIYKNQAYEGEFSDWEYLAVKNNYF